MTPAPSHALEQILASGQLLSSTLELGELLTVVLRLSAGVVESESASLLLLDEQTSELYFDVALGLGEEASRFRLPLGQGIAGWVAQERKPMIINDVRTEPRWSPEMDKRSGFTTRSILAVPMIMKGRVIGVLEAINKKQGDFTPEDASHFEAFASQATVAIENARLVASLREERFRLEAIFDEMTDSAILSDIAGRVLLANPSALKYLTGNRPINSLADLRGFSFQPTWPQIAASPALVQLLELSREKPKKLILSGKATRVQLSSSSSSGPAEPGWLLVLRDVTEERLKEKLKRTFLSLISHKLKTPLASIIGYADILKNALGSTPQEPMVAKAIDSVGLQGRKLGDLVDKLLKYVNLEDERAAPPALCQLDGLVRDTVQGMTAWLTAEKAVVKFEPSGISVLAYRADLTEALKNLIENAVKFDSKPAKEVLVRAESRNSEVHVSVTDTGPGIPHEEQQRIFEEFHQIEDSFTGQIHGWGLGLAYVKKVMERHGGRMIFDSAAEKGTTVTLCLPGERPA